MKLIHNNHNLFSFFVLCGCCAPLVTATLFPATGLEPGDIQIVAYASDAPDAFAFVSWVSINPGTEIYFTDEGWDSCSNEFRSDLNEEGVIKFTAPTHLAAGSVHEYVDGVTSSAWWNVEKGTVSLNSHGDQLIAFQRVNGKPYFIYAFDTTDGWEDGCSSSVDTDLKSGIPTGLVDGVTAVTFDHADNFWYPPWFSTSATLPTLKEWMMNRDRFIATSLSARRANEYEVPATFTILSGERGVNGYTEYIPGTAPCIIVSGHDGDLSPDSIVDRNHGCLGSSGECIWTKNCSSQDVNACEAKTDNDDNTQDMARRAVDIFESFTGNRCHLVVNRLDRSKLDPNREVEEAAQFDAQAIQAYQEFHNFIIQAKNTITAPSSTCGKGLLFDFHGHSHPEARIELGYKITATQLRQSDAYVDGLAYTSSIRNMPTHTGKPFSTILRGLDSLGELFQRATPVNTTGYESVPSPTVPAPAVGESYFQGDYIVEEHGSQNGGTIDAVQIEFPRYLRAEYFGMQEDILTAFGEVVLPQYLIEQYGFQQFSCE